MDCFDKHHSVPAYLNILTKIRTNKQKKLETQRKTEKKHKQTKSETQRQIEMKHKQTKLEAQRQTEKKHKQSKNKR